MYFDFNIPTHIIFGEGSLSRLHLEKLPGKKALIVMSSGKSVQRHGYLDCLNSELKLANVRSVIFNKISPNPVKSDIMAGARLAREESCDFIIGFGGGSSIDAAKAIAVMAANSGDYWDYVGGGSGGKKPFENSPLPIVAITTTAGTGTEADGVAVITKDDTNEKVGFGNIKMFPAISIVDPGLMLTVPPKYTAYQAFDALFHATECYISKKANLMSEMFSLTSIENIGTYLPYAVDHGEHLTARTHLAFANTLSGMVMTLSSCSSAHSLEHAMSAFHPELPHGAGLIMISRAYYTHFIKAHACDDRFIKMAKALGKEDAKDPMDFISALTELQEVCGVANLKMSDYGIKEDEFEEFANNAFSTMGRLFQFDRIPLSLADCVAIYKNSYK